MAEKETSRRLLRLPEVRRAVGYARTAIYQKIKDGEFPAPVSLGARAVAWTSDSIENWIESRIKATAAAKPSRATALGLPASGYRSGLKSLSTSTHATGGSSRTRRGVSK